jgi:hypothetical protein
MGTNEYWVASFPGIFTDSHFNLSFACQTVGMPDASFEVASGMLPQACKFKTTATKKAAHTQRSIFGHGIQ